MNSSAKSSILRLIDSTSGIFAPYSQTPYTATGALIAGWCW
ncbi:hypothetical protein IP95_00830 [Extensimonas vulgaris]|uniref:Uncharacterized protein n=1 Tax=Extensimonas vulgaris TaxID=1031594 RepID=A0A369AU41_9BURK|nr:hypothetical protein DFR45_101276 [Extensimonas vulgaris]TWI40641.1 hypothetical protein IP95_00830 [Extensimonas vulgaris]